MWASVALRVTKNGENNMKHTALLLLVGLLVLGAAVDASAECVSAEGAEVCADAGESGAAVSVAYDDGEGSGFFFGVGAGM